ncbi:MAG: twin-arginine translocase TatA/TatE family subunit [Acidimicrobiia bacterium]
MFKQVGAWEIILILGVLLLMFGARKLPDLARSIGASAKEFRKGLDEGATEDAVEDEKQPTE